MNILIELGDPCCKWQNGQGVLISEGLSHPGLKDKMTTNSALLQPSCTANKTSTPGTSSNGGSAIAPTTDEPATNLPLSYPIDDEDDDIEESKAII